MMRPLPCRLRFFGLICALALLATTCEGSAVADRRLPPRPTAAPAGYHLYFTGPTPNHLTGGIPDQIAAAFDAAQKTIDVAMYQFDLPVLSDALIRAHQRGVRVRLVTDTDSVAGPVFQDLQRAGIRVVDDQRQALMHNKFAVIDGVSLWTGSMNFTENDAYRNNNNELELDSPPLAENYTREFEEMFIERQFGPRSLADTPHPTVTLDGTLIENYFAPEDRVAGHILSLLRSAQTSVYFMAFTFTRADFASALIDKDRAGITVQGVFEQRQIEAGSDSAWKALRGAGLDVHLDGNPYNLHSKVFIVDRQTVVTGSYNFTQSADQSNDENLLIIHNADVAQAFFAEWQKVWMLAEK
jgi:phosphatidylserine/phosphatidylglycerophosphate/cardiolipin synthase-like enzyme